MHVFEQHGAVAASVACRFVLRRRSAIGCGSSDACVRAASSSGSVCCLQVRAETKKRKAPAPVIPRALPLLQPGSADYKCRPGDWDCRAVSDWVRGSRIAVSHLTKWPHCSCFSSRCHPPVKAARTACKDDALPIRPLDQLLCNKGSVDDL